jgi:enediyne biosynthesis protein E4
MKMRTKLQLLIAGLLLATIGTGLGQQPNITTQPQSCINAVGSTATFTVEATGTEPLAYQWQKYGAEFTDLADCTNAAMVLTNVQTSHTGDYRVVVTNIVGAVTSAVAQLNVILPPKITVQPTNWASVSLGASVTNRTQATGALLSYQWCLNGAPVPSQTNRWIILTNLQLSDAGDYTAVVTNIGGSVTSLVVTLTPDPTFTQINTGVLVTDTAGGWHGSWVDYDGDGNLDFSAAPSGSLLEATRLYHNEGNGSFRKVTTNAIAQTLVQSWTHVWGDYNNDGKLDLFVPNYSNMNDMLFRNAGNGLFTRVTSGHPVIDAATTITGVWRDYDRDGFLDLFVIAGQCGDLQNDILYRNNGDGTFRKMTAAEVGPIVSDLAVNDCTVWADVDNDGWPELCRNTYGGCSGTGAWTNQVYHLDSQGKFYLMDIGTMKKGTEGYSEITWADYDNDGFLDGLVGAESGSLGLFRNLAGLGFTNVAASAFANPITNCWAWSAVDYDNDGWQDLVITLFTPVYHCALFRNNGDGTFTSKNIGGPTGEQGEPCWGDYNNDGFLDVLVLYNPGVRNSLFQNNGNINHWLKVKLDGRASNRSGIGAKVRVNATIGGRNFWQMREISGQGVGMDNGLIAHFGLGDATNVATLRIEWPSGIVQELQNVTNNQFLTVVESQSYSGARPAFTSATKQTSGLQISITEPAAGALYCVEASSDLLNWTKRMVRTSAGATAQFTDSSTTNSTNRFYRIVVP